MSIRRFSVRFLLPIVAAVLFGGISSSVSSLPASAVSTPSTDSVQITLSPTKQRVDIAAGTTTNGTFTIRNTGKLPFSFKVYAAPYTVTSDTNYTPGFASETPRTQISRWVTFTKTAYSLPPDATVEIPYRITVPASIPAGSQYAAIFAETDGQKSGSVITKKRVGMLLYAKPKGATKTEGSAAFNNIPLVIFGSRINSEAKVHNTGNTDFDTTVRFEQKNVFGGANQHAEEIRTVLPESTRTIAQTTRSSTPFAIYTVTQSAIINGKITTKTSTIYVISPLAACIVTIIVIIGISIGVWRVLVKSRTKNRSKNS